MISAISSPCFPLNSPIAFPQSTIQKKVDDLYHKCQSFWQSVTTGAFVGLSNLSFEILVSEILYFIPNIENVLSDPALAEEYMESSFFSDVIEAPILEEIVFRVVIQNFFHTITKKIVPDRNVEIFSCQLKLAALVAIIATSLLFGWAHLGSGLGIMHVILATIGGITFGILKETKGLTASISAHMTNNAVVYGLCKLA